MFHAFYYQTLLLSLINLSVFSFNGYFLFPFQEVFAHILIEFILKIYLIHFK